MKTELRSKIVAYCKKGPEVLDRLDEMIARVRIVSPGTSWDQAFDFIRSCYNEAHADTTPAERKAAA